MAVPIESQPNHSAETPPASFSRSAQLREKAHRMIPGGAHTYAKGDDQFPEWSPGFIRRGKGCHVWDVDDNEFIEYGMGLRAVTLGHAEPRVVRAAHDAMLQGTNFTRPAELEVQCAEQFLELIESADCVKFTKDGSTAVTAAIKLARAKTGKTRVAFCGDHPFFSYDDWFMGHTPVDAGIPPSATSESHSFRYNDLDSLEELFATHANEFAAVILEATKLESPQPGFLSGLRRLCDTTGTVLILDEMITGFRWANNGAQGYFGITPDLSTFGKALANGFSVSALAGKREIMDLGGLTHRDPRVFLLSTTHGGETHGLAAAMATMRIYQTEPVVEHLWTYGGRLREQLNQIADDLGLLDQVQVIGPSVSLVFTTRDALGNPSQPFRTLFLQELIRGGVIAPSLVVSYAHGRLELEQTCDAWRAALRIYGRALEDGPDRFLQGPASQPVYRRWNQPRSEGS